MNPNDAHRRKRGEGLFATVGLGGILVNLIVISVDTLRADHMSLHGYPRNTTPRIAAFAETAVTFESARAPWPKTVPSMVSTRQP